MNPRYIPQALLALSLMFSQALKAQGSTWNVDVPPGVKYVEAPKAQREKAIALFQPTPGKQGIQFSSIMFGDPVICGPFLWNELQLNSPVKNPPVKKIMLQVAMKTVTMFMEAKPFSTHESSGLVTALNELVKGESFTIRPPQSDELKQYWALIDFDIVGPIFVLESKKFDVLVDFKGGLNSAYVELLRSGSYKIRLPE